MDDVGHLVAEIYECAGLFRKQGERVAVQSGQTQARWQVLSVVSNDGFTVPQIARRLGVTRQSVQRVVNELHKDNLLSFVANPDHRTSQRVVISPQGKNTLTEITAHAEMYHQNLQAEVGSANVKMVSEEVRKINKQLQQILAAYPLNLA
jgi:DNA-binding MarR family transcriptional regulator